MLRLKYLVTQCGVAAPMARLSGARDGARQAARDGEKRPLSWGLRPQTEKLQIECETGPADSAP